MIRKSSSILILVYWFLALSSYGQQTLVVRG